MFSPLECESGLVPPARFDELPLKNHLSSRLVTFWGCELRLALAGLGSLDTAVAREGLLNVCQGTILKLFLHTTSGLRQLSSLSSRPAAQEPFKFGKEMWRSSAGHPNWVDFFQGSKYHRVFPRGRKTRLTGSDKDEIL